MGIQPPRTSTNLRYTRHLCVRWQKRLEKSFSKAMPITPDWATSSRRYGTRRTKSKLIRMVLKSSSLTRLTRMDFFFWLYIIPEYDVYTCQTTSFKTCLRKPITKLGMVEQTGWSIDLKDCQSLGFCLLPHKKRRQEKDKNWLHRQTIRLWGRLRWPL